MELNLRMAEKPEDKPTKKEIQKKADRKMMYDQLFLDVIEDLEEKAIIKSFHSRGFEYFP